MEERNAQLEEQLHEYANLKTISVTTSEAYERLLKASETKYVPAIYLFIYLRICVSIYALTNLDREQDESVSRSPARPTSRAALYDYYRNINTLILCHCRRPNTSSGSRPWTSASASRPNTASPARPGTPSQGPRPMSATTGRRLEAAGSARSTLHVGALLRPPV